MSAAGAVVGVACASTKGAFVSELSLSDAARDFLRQVGARRSARSHVLFWAMYECAFLMPTFGRLSRSSHPAKMHICWNISWVHPVKLSSVVAPRFFSRTSHP